MNGLPALTQLRSLSGDDVDYAVLTHAAENAPDARHGDGG